MKSVIVQFLIRYYTELFIKKDRCLNRVFLNRAELVENYYKKVDQTIKVVGI